MITTRSWEKVQTAVGVSTAALVGAFWLVYLKFSIWAWPLAVYMAVQARANVLRDNADERQLMIATRAGYLSQKLMLGAAMLLILTPSGSVVSGHREALAAVILLGVASEGSFRKLQGGADERRPAPAWLWLLLAASFLGLAWSITRVLGDIAASFGMTPWGLLRLLWTAEPRL